MHAMDGSLTTLSSAQTFLTKTVFPILWTSGFAVGSWQLFSSPNPGAGIFWSFGVLWSLFIWWSCVPLKRVRMDDRALYISNYRREIAVPLREVAEVTGVWWNRDRQVTIRLHSETEFGSKIVFMPKQRWLAWGPHPVVAEIRSAVARATGAASVHI
jgi:hypothetical protein